MATGRLPDPNSAPVTSKGDLYTYSTRADRLAVGNNGETLVADSSQTTGLRYNPPVASLANPVINGGMDVWQRGTSIVGVAGTGTYTADRWFWFVGTEGTVSRQTTGDTTNLPNIQYCLRAQRNNGVSATGQYPLDYSFESFNSIPFAGKTVTVSFYARRGANYSPTSNLLDAGLYSGTGTDQRYSSGFTGSATVATSSVTLTTTWQRFAFTGTMASTATQLALRFSMNTTGTAGAADFFEITGVQIDVGTWTASTAPTFRRSGGTLAGELAACQRYYYRLTPGETSRGLATGYAFSTTQGWFQIPFPVEMRTRPTALEQSGTANHYALTLSNSNAQDLTSVPAFNGFTTTRMGFLTGTSTTGGLTAGNGTFLSVSNTAAYLGWSAEL